MSKKQDFLRKEQSRDKHPESGMVGSAAAVEEQARRHSVQSVSEQDRQAPHSGKSANDHNKMGEQAPTQRNEGRRTPHSRHDQEMQVGSGNKPQVRQGSPASGERTPRPSGKS
ncbi:hypothetical protein PE066_11140 [Ramlibacter tataouinensis]|uniref:hypothetical protein n=1 Tax=Ramlibacter tataouinensis TaxID=94132 RepID=UPI0022F3F313|nr:hypothetical protein [Ramlibacter tataouinensis]WBY04090.1 hypothetical protein PE066_11140 [Ramlibacter tataouinensis]